MASRRCSRTWAVSLLVLLFAVPSLSYNLQEGIAGSVLNHKDLEEESDSPTPKPGEAATFGLLHMDLHPDSPFYDAGLSLADRLQNAIKRSVHRVSVVKTILSANYSVERGVDFDPSKTDVSPGTTFESPLTASPGSYIMTISLGSPPQTKTAIADTGSDLVWVQCAPCKSCYQQNDPFYAPSKSSTYKKLSYSNGLCSDLPQTSNSGGYCTYQYGYGDQSTTQGDFASETISLTTTTGSSLKVPNFAFGCGHQNQGTFSGVDGLVGLGQGPISFPSQLGSLFGGQFSYCLVSADSSASTSSPILFGAAAVTSGINLKYTPLVESSQNPTFYYVTLKDIAVGGQALNLPKSTFAIQSDGNGGVILDSGTTITQLITAAYTPFLSKIQSLITYPTADSSQTGLDLCYDTSQVQSPSFPTVTLKFSGVSIDLPSENTFLAVDNQGTVCLAFAGTSDFTIIGNIQQQNFYFLYDVANQRVGIAPTQCDSLTAPVQTQ